MLLSTLLRTIWIIQTTLINWLTFINNPSYPSTATINTSAWSESAICPKNPTLRLTLVIGLRVNKSTKIRSWPWKLWGILSSNSWSSRSKMISLLASVRESVWHKVRTWPIAFASRDIPPLKSGMAVRTHLTKWISLSPTSIQTSLDKIPMAKERDMHLRSLKSVDTIRRILSIHRSASQ